MNPVVHKTYLTETGLLQHRLLFLVLIGFNGDDPLWEARDFAKAVAALEIASVRLYFRACLFTPPVQLFA